MNRRPFFETVNEAKEWFAQSARIRAAVTALAVCPLCDLVTDRLEGHVCKPTAALEDAPLVDQGYDLYSDPELAAWAD